MKEDLQIKRKMAAAIAIQCLKLNSIGDAMKEGSGPAVWFEIVAHIGAIKVYSLNGGWVENGGDEDNEPDFNMTLYDFSDLRDYQNCIDYLKSLEEKKC